MTKAEIIEVVLELYSARKEMGKTWSTMPVQTRMKNSKSTRVSSVRNFIPRDGENRRHAFLCAERPWRTSRNSNRLLMPLAELMVSYMEWATQFTYDYGDMWEQYYDSVESNFDKTVKYIAVNGLWEKYDKRLQQCVKWSDGSGYGFADAVASMYKEGKAIDHELATKFPTTRMTKAEIKKMFGK